MARFLRDTAVTSDTIESVFSILQRLAHGKPTDPRSSIVVAPRFCVFSTRWYSSSTEVLRFVAKRWTFGLAAEANLDAAGRCALASVLICQHGLSEIPWESQNFNKKTAYRILRS